MSYTRSPTILGKRKRTMPTRLQVIAWDEIADAIRRRETEAMDYLMEYKFAVAPLFQLSPATQRLLFHAAIDASDVEVLRFLLENLLDPKYISEAYLERASPRLQALIAYYRQYPLDPTRDEKMYLQGGKRRSRSRSMRGGSHGRPKLVSVKRSRNPQKKYDALFKYPDGHTKTVSFGATGYEDYTMHHDKERRRRYIERHSRREPFTDPTKPGTLSRYILWETPTVRSGVSAYKRRFHV